ILAERGIERVGLDQARQETNVLSLHVPLTVETEHLIDAEFINEMPDGALVINVSRGSLIDSEALAQAVISGKLSGVALDAIDADPTSDQQPPLTPERGVMTPHVAYYFDRTNAEYVRIQAQNAVTHLESGKPDVPV